MLMPSSEHTPPSAAMTSTGQNFYPTCNARAAAIETSVHQFSPLQPRASKPNRAALQKVSQPAQFGDDDRVRRATSASIAPLDGLEALRAAAQQQAIREVQSEKQLAGRIWKTERPNQPALSHADPLAPLRERDQIALSSWFDRDDMLDVETDVDRCLLVLLPAPCWEDDPDEFWQEIEFLQDLI